MSLVVSELLAAARRCTQWQLARMLLLTLAVCGFALVGGCSNGPKIVPDEIVSISATHKFNIDWSRDVGEAGERPAVRLSPYVGDTHVVAVNAKGRVTSVAREGGGVQWTAVLNKPITAGVSGDGERVYVASADGEVFALDQHDGTLVWQAMVSSEVIAAPVAGAGSVVVRSVDGRVVALERVNGERRWGYSYTVPALSLHGNGRALAVDDGYLIGLDNGTLVALRARDGRVFWELDLAESAGRSAVDKLNDLDADVRLYDGSVYAVNYQGKLAHIDPSKGQVDWSVPMSSAVGFAVSAEKIYVTDEFDTVWALSRRNGEVIWSQEGFTHRRLTAPTIIGDDIVVGDYEGYLHLLSGADGTMIGRRKIGASGIMMDAVMRDETLYVQDRGGKLAAVQLQ